jgi:multimeric flavodoxin WrbA
MRVFIVHAHPEPKSFNGALTRAATEALAGAGHETVLSDLYAMNFNPVSDRRNFTTVANPDAYRQQAEEAHAAAHDGFAPDLQAEMDKLFWCDALILQFPLWWFGLSSRAGSIACSPRAAASMAAASGTTAASSPASAPCAPSRSADRRRSTASAA